jgi:hypothetical protein
MQQRRWAQRRCWGNTGLMSERVFSPPRAGVVWQQAANDRHDLDGKNLPNLTMFTRSPFGPAWRFRSILKLIARMVPSPNSS